MLGGIEKVGARAQQKGKSRPEHPNHQRASEDHKQEGVTLRLSQNLQRAFQGAI